MKSEKIKNSLLSCVELLEAHNFIARSRARKLAEGISKRDKTAYLEISKELEYVAALAKREGKRYGD